MDISYRRRGIEAPGDEHLHPILHTHGQGDHFTLRHKHKIAGSRIRGGRDKDIHDPLCSQGLHLPAGYPCHKSYGIDPLSWELDKDNTVKVLLPLERHGIHNMLNNRIDVADKGHPLHDILPEGYGLPPDIVRGKKPDQKDEYKKGNDP